MAEIEKASKHDVEHISQTANSVDGSAVDQTLEEIQAMNRVRIIVLASFSYVSKATPWR